MFAEGSSGAARQEKVVVCCWQMVPSSGVRKEKYFIESVWHWGSLVWNQLERGQSPQLVSPCNVNFSPLETSQLMLRGGSVPRKLFVMISLLAFVYKLLYNLNVSTQNLKCTGFVQPEVQMKFSSGSWQDLLSHFSNWHSNQRSKNTAKISGAIECLEKLWQEWCFSFPSIIKFIYTSEKTSAQTIYWFFLFFPWIWFCILERLTAQPAWTECLWLCENCLILLVFRVYKCRLQSLGRHPRCVSVTKQKRFQIPSSNWSSCPVKPFLSFRLSWLLM